MTVNLSANLFKNNFKIESLEDFNCEFNEIFNRIIHKIFFVQFVQLMLETSMKILLCKINLIVISLFPKANLFGSSPITILFVCVILKKSRNNWFCSSIIAKHFVEIIYSSKNTKEIYHNL